MLQSSVMNVIIDGGNEITPETMAQDGLEWALEETVAEKRTDVEEVLKGLYIHGMIMFGRHVELLQERVEEAGGVRKISQSDASGYGINRVHLNDDTFLGVSELLIPEPATTQLPDVSVLGDKVEQKQVLQISFGGNNIGVDGVSASKDPDSAYLRPGALKHILKGKYIPTSVCIMEGVVTQRTSSRHDDHQEAIVSGTVAQLVGRMWGAKLRPEFAPDPIKDPEGYADWANSDPVPQLSVAFGASDLLRDRHWRYAREISFGIAPKLESVVSDSHYSRLDTDGAKKLLRFEQLLARYYQHFMGEAMPVRTEYSGMERNSLPASSVSG